LAHAECERPEQERQRGEVVEEPDQQRLAPEERRCEEGQPLVGAQRAQQRPQGERQARADEREQHQVRALRGPEGHGEQRAGEVVEQVLRLREREREVLLRLPGWIPEVAQRRDRRRVLG
jgi:hypothetical protein